MIMNPQHSSKKNEHYTPVEIVEAARELMGEITFDPFSSAKANEVVRADRYYSFEDRLIYPATPVNAFTWDWTPFMGKYPAKVFCNPPGGCIDKDSNPSKSGRSSIAVGWDRVVGEYNFGNCQDAVFLGFTLELLPKRPDIWDFPVCIVSNTATADCVNGSGRIMFDYINERGERVRNRQPTHGNCIVYLPPKGSSWYSKAEEFKSKFEPLFGRVILPPK